jgi:hypothetical protein
MLRLHLSLSKTLVFESACSVYENSSFRQHVTDAAILFETQGATRVAPFKLIRGQPSVREEEMISAMLLFVPDRHRLLFRK